MTEENDGEMEEGPMEEEDEEGENDLEAYMAEMEALETDFSDLDDLDMEELKEMQNAVSKVKERQALSEMESSEDLELDKTDPEMEYAEGKDGLMSDFSDLEDIDMDELREMKEAIDEVRQDGVTDEEDFQQPAPISSELEERIKEELAKKQEEELEEVMTPEKFVEYLKDKRDKIWYHALWYLTFEVADHTSSKELLHEELKEVTSKSAVDDIPYHQFVFGLGYLLRLSVNEKQVIRYQSGGRFKVNINIKNLKEWLEIAGEPISRRPVIPKEEKEQMFMDFLKDDFSDI